MARMTIDPEVWEMVLDRLAAGQALAAICRDEAMPGTSTVYDRIESDEAFAGRFRARKAIGVRAIADDCLAIADEPVAPGDATAVANKRVRIDTRLRLAGKWAPKEFGDKVALTDGDGGPLQIVIRDIAAESK